MARTPPGETRARVLAVVRGALEEGRAPSLREVQAAVGLRSPEVVRQHLLRLVEEGALERDEGARGWRLPERERVHVLGVPLLGRVPAGGPLEAVEEREGVVPVDAARAQRRGRGAAGLFALRVEGESMRDAGILPGDVVIVDSKARVEHGDVVVARLDGDATVKRLWRPHVDPGRGRLELRPENPAFAPIVPAPGQDLAILGKVVEVRRELS